MGRGGMSEQVSGSFEGSFLGDAGKLADHTRLECKICWTVYDPAEGDPVWQIAPGTPFAQLPAHWRCPVCDGAHDQFMVVLED
jgi:rubredoxin